MSNRIELLDEPALAVTATLDEPEAVRSLPAVRQATEVATAPRSRDDMLMMAMDRGYTPEQIAQFMDLRDRHEAREAEKAFNEAMAAFKANPPVIVKDKHVSFTSQKGQTNYDHATHFRVTTAIAAALAAHGLTHSWKSEQGDGKITVICTIKHRLGHSESTSMEAAYDASGGKNSIQAIGSAKTYLERYTLLGITGLSTQDLPDDDGVGSGGRDKDDAEAFAIRDEWIERANAALNDAVLKRTWSMALEEIGPLNRLDVHAAVKAAVVAKSKALKEVAKPTDAGEQQ